MRESPGKKESVQRRFFRFRRIFLDLYTLSGYNSADCTPSEVTTINKQKFLTELGKLLTFMYEEDRLRALEMYSRMFEETEDERALLQALVSPTKQAVIVARAYNANIGRLSVSSQKAPAEDRDANGVPDYVQAIETVREAAVAAQILRAPAPPAEESVDENQMTLFDGEADSEADSEAEPAETPSAESEQPETAQGDGESAPVSSADETGEEVPAESEPQSQDENEQMVLHDEPEVTPLTWHAAPGSANNGTKEKIEYFTLGEEGAHDAAAAETHETAFNIDTAAMKKPRRKAKVFALIVYILFAIPITLALIALLLIPALLFLGLSIGTIICGVVVVSAAFQGFAVFADIMVLMGVALVLFAFGLLFLWTAIWFVGGVIVSLVHGVAALCDKWCYKEVLEG